VLVDLIVDDDEEFNEIRKAQNLICGTFSPFKVRNRLSNSSKISPMTEESKLSNSNSQVEQGIKTRG
jgi:hypothetical protein